MTKVEYRINITVTQFAGSKKELISRGSTDGYTLSELLDPAMIDRAKPRLVKVLDHARRAAHSLKPHKGPEDEEGSKDQTHSALGSAELRKLADALDAGKIRLGDVIAYRDPKDPQTLIIKSYHHK